MDPSAILAPPPGLSLVQLHYLVAVARASTWAEAADHLGVSQSALSQAIGEIERRLGVALFERDGRRRVPAAAAAPVFAFAQRVLADARDLQAWLDDVASGRAGRLRIGMIDSAAVDHFPATLRTFRAERPELDFRLTVAPSAELVAMVEAGDLDLAVCVEPPRRRPDLVVEALVDEPLWLYAPPGTEIGPPSSWGPFLTFPPGSHTRTVIVDALTRAGATVDIVAESHQPDVIGGMVRVGLGWAVLPAAQAGRGAAGLSPVTGGEAPTGPLATRTLSLVRRREGAAQQAADDLAMALRTSAAL